MVFQTYDQYELDYDYGPYPSPPAYPPPPIYPPRPATPPPPNWPTHRPRHARDVPPPPAYPPMVPVPHHTELARLRTNYRWLRRTMTLAALGYFVAYLCLSGYFPGVMDTQLFGTLNLGVVLGLLQVPVTLMCVIAYEYTARGTIDPAAHRVRISEAEWRERLEETR